MKKQDYIEILAKLIDNLGPYEALKTETIMKLRTLNLDELETLYERYK